MSMLSDVEIEEAVAKKEIIIKPFEKSLIEPASYDLRVGRALVGGMGISDLKERGLILKTGEWAELETLEEISLSDSIAATFGVRSSITRKGLDWFGGPQVDPGYNGKLYIGIFNPSSEPFRINHGDKFCTIMFHRLGKSSSRPYSGQYQRMTTFPEEDVERMIKLEAPTLSDVITSVGILESTVTTLTKEMTTFTQTLNALKLDVGWIKRILFGILMALIVGISIVIFGKFV